MARTPYLYDKLAASGARFGEYLGVETAASFGDDRAEYAALRSGCGLFDLGWRASFMVTGEDGVRWLNGMVTNNVRDLAPHHGVYSFLLNPQGHILGDMVVFHCGDYLRIETDGAQAEKLRAIFDRYIIMDDVELGQTTPANAIGLEGPKSAEVLKAAGFYPGEQARLEMRDVEAAPWKLTVIRTSREPGSGYELWFTPPALAGDLWDRLVAAGTAPVGFEALELWRVSQGIPRYGRDIRERDLPQETEQHHALNFTKGCYVGQEIVERIRSRGQVHRKFAGFMVSGAVPAAGSKVTVGGKEVGELTSVATVPTSNGSPQILALGYIRREAGTPGAVVQVDGAEATVTDLSLREAD